MAARRDRMLGGALVIAVGAAVMLAVFFAPRGMHAPAWVVYAAGGAFVLAGLALLAEGTGRRVLARWLPSLVVACLLAPAAWLAFGSGPRRCMVSAWGFGSRMLGRHSDLLCRLAFGAGTLVGVLILLLFVRDAWRGDLEP
jgi:hypothetical protein